MRLVKIPGIDYETFAKIRRPILKHIPFALLNDCYDKELDGGTAFLNFWDVSYIPKQLRKYIVQPPASREPVEQLLDEFLAEAKAAGLVRPDL